MKNLLSRLIGSILELDVYTLSKRDFSALSYFEKKNNAYSLSSEFTKKYLSSFIKEIEKNTYYEIVDNLNERLFLFKFESSVFLLGPYIKRFSNESEIEKIGFLNNVPTSLMEMLKSQYFKLPIIDSYRIENTINSIINALYDKRTYQYTYKRINNQKKSISQEKSHSEIETLEKSIYDKYEAENNVLYLIEHGEVEKLKLAMQNYSKVNREDYLVTFHSTNPQAAMASFRALLRKAAEKSGLPVPIIDRIISKHTQLMLVASSNQEQMNSLMSLSIELSSEVRKYLMNIRYDSPLIKSICEFLFIHYNQNYSLDDLAKNFSISSYYLAHLFKKETGNTIHYYIENIRLSKASELLQENHLTISEISKLVGYIDNNYFSKVFKKRFGLSPKEYRLANKSND